MGPGHKARDDGGTVHQSHDYGVLALAAVGRPGVATETNSVACSSARPNGVGIEMRNGANTRVLAIGASETSMSLSCVAYLIHVRPGLWPAMAVKYNAQTTTGP